MKTPRLHYFKQNTAELPEGYRKPIKRRRKPAVASAREDGRLRPDVPERIIIPVRMKAKPVIRRRTPRGRLMPLRMKNEWIPRNADWCQINGQKVRQDIFFGEVVGRVFIPGLFTGEACGSCGPSMLDFGGGCGDSGCEGCGGGGGGGGGEGDGCAGEGCGTGGAACEGCAGCEGEGCASAGCESAGCDTGGCSTGGGGGGGGGCESSGCAVDGCAGCAACADSSSAGCESSGCSTGGGGGCDTGCTGCAGEGCGGCEAAGCASTGCADSGCGMGCDAGCAAACVSDTGCGMGCVGPASDFGSWGPTAGVDYTGGQAGLGQAGWTAPSNTGLGNAIGAPGWATGNFGVQGVGGPTGTGLGPGSTSIGTPTASTAPGVAGFRGDFGAPPGGAIGMTGNVGTQAGPGIIGGPGSVQQGEGLGPTGFGIAPAAPSAPAVADPSSRSDINPAQNFGPDIAANTGFFGVGQAQAADRGTDTLAAQMQSAPTTSPAGLEGTFSTVQAAANALAQSNPALAEALSQAAANMQAPGLAAPGQLGPGITGFEQATPGAQTGFTGVSQAQAAAGGPFSSQLSATGGPVFSESTQGKGDRGATETTQQTNPNMDLVGPMTTQQGYQQLAAEMNAQQQAQQGYQQLAAEMNAQQNQQSMMTAQELGEQGRAGSRGPTETQMSPQQTINEAFNAITMANQQQAMQQAAPFDAQARGEQGRGPNTFDSRFGSPDIFAPTQEAPTRGNPDDPDVPPAENQTIALGRGQDVISNLDPATRGVGREAAPLGLLDMLAAPARGSPVGNPYQAGSQFTGGRGSPSTGGRSGSSFGQFGPSGGRGSPSSGGRASSPGLSITVGGRGAPAAGYYNTGGRGIAPGAKGAEYGGIYGPGVATGRAGTNTFGVDSRSGAYGFYDPATGIYYR